MAVKKFSLEAVIDLTDKMTKPLQNIERSMGGFGKRMQKNFGGVGKNIQSLDKGINKAAVGLGVVAVAGGAAAFALGKSFIDAGAEVEKYKTVLTTMLGSQEEANARFEEYSKLAAVTPFELNDVVELGNALQALGRYSKENLIMLGDLAAASGKPIDQVKNAFAKLVSGQKGEAVNMFRDLLISNDDWIKATGKGVKKTGELMATTEEMIAALPAILGKKGFTGMMDNMSKSYEGMTSNFKDTITRFKQGIGTMLLPAAKNLMGVLTKKMQEFSDVTNVKGRAAVAAIGKLLDGIAKWIDNFDIAKAINDISNLFATIAKVVRFIKPLVPAILALVVAVKLVTFFMAAFNAVMLVLSLNPVTLTILAIIAGLAILTVSVIYIKNHWAELGETVTAFGKTVLLLLGPIGVVARAMIDLVTGIITISDILKNGGIVGFLQTIGAGIANMLIKPMANFLSLLAKIPGLGGLIGPLSDSLNGVSAGLESTATRYSNPETRVSESSVSSYSRNVNEVYVRPDKGAQISTSRGGMPQMYLNYGAAQ